MNTTKLIIISCIVFVLAILLYLIIKKNNKFKEFILKLDDKITKHNNKVEARRNAKNNNGLEKEEETQNKENGTKKEKTKLFNNKSKSSKNALSQNSKLKPSKAVEQIRPILLPENKENEERDIKLLEMQKRPEGLPSSSQKSLDFKYGTPKTETRNFNTNSQQNKRINQNQDDDFISFSKEKDVANPLKRDTKRQFDDIKNFLQLPENLKTAQEKGVSYDGKNFRTVDKVDYSKANLREPIYNGYNMQNANISLKNQNSNVMQTKTKYSRPQVNIYPREEQINAQNYEDDYLSQEQENIDLNKLPNNLKKMIIQNILERKNYD